MTALAFCKVCGTDTLHRIYEGAGCIAKICLRCIDKSLPIGAHDAGIERKIHKEGSD